MNRSVRRRCGGFTLLEVLVVVVIAVLVTLFAVPAYQKSQDKNRYMAASGVLMDVANAARMLKEDYPDVATGDLEVKSRGSGCPANPASGALQFMYCHNYLNDIPLSSNSFMGYKFKLNAQGGVSCGCGANAVACMSGANRIPEYTCAWVDKAGILHHNSI